MSFGELTKGQALSGTIPAEPPVEPRDRWTIRGTAVKKVDGRDFVTGHHQYTPDVVRPDMLHGRIVRPDGYGATLVSVDDTRARSMPGVSIVRDGDFLGVVAPTERAAIRAASAVQAAWRRCRDQPSSDTLFDYLKTHPEREGVAGMRRSCSATSAAPSRVRAIFEESYRIPYIAHVPLEPRAAVAEWQDGKLTVWTGTQRPFGVRSELAEAFRIPGRSRAGDHARHGLGLRRQAYRRGGDRGGAAREGRQAVRSSSSGRAPRSSAGDTSARLA